jgi:hypothetical protein
MILTIQKKGSGKGLTCHQAQPGEIATIVI